MSPPSVVHPEEELATQHPEKQVRPEAGSKKKASEPGRRSLPEMESAFRLPLFQGSMLEFSPTRPKARSLDLVASLVLHTLLLMTLVLIPLAFTDAIDLKMITQTWLVAPPPPPPPPPPPAAPIVAKAAPMSKRVFTSGGKLVAPVAIPSRIAMIKEAPLEPEVGVGVIGGVPGGVPGGQAGGVIGGILASTSSASAMPPPPRPEVKAPIRVGGRVKPPRIITAQAPDYPAIAKQARVQGDVVIDAVIDESGNVAQMRVVSGHPLLMTAALEALKKWRYEPTYLNNEPYPVQLLVTVRFRLS